MRSYKVFISSTYEDLIEERKGVAQAILECGCTPVCMEQFPAANGSPWDTIKRRIEASDYFILIIGGRYGSTLKDESGKVMSYVEREYTYAISRGKPVLVFVRKDIDDLPANKSEQTRLGKARLARFTDKAMAGKLVSFWHDKYELKSKVLHSLFSALGTDSA